MADETEKGLRKTAEMHGENFPVALAVLPRTIRRDLAAAYYYARHVDQLGDAADGDRVRQLNDVAADVRALYSGRRPADPVVSALGPLVARTKIDIDPWLRLVDANLVDQRVTRYETFDDLVDYCRLSANPVGEIVLHIFDRATPGRVLLSDRICTALQLLEHIQDVDEDFEAGRVYMPQCDLRRFKVAENLLSGPTAATEVTSLIRYETDRATAWLGAGAPLVSTLRGWARLAVSGYIAGGRAAARNLRHSGFDPMSDTLKPTRRQIAASWLESTVRWPG